MATKPGINNLFNIFEGMNAFGAGPGARTRSLLDSNLITQDAIDKANRQSIGTGIVTGLASYLATPKNKGYGSAIPYFAQSYLAGSNAAKAPFQGIADKYLMDTQLTEQQRILGQRDKMTESVERFITQNPNMAYIRNLPDATKNAIITKSAELSMTPSKPLSFDMQQFNDTFALLQQQNPDEDDQVLKNQAYKIIQEAKKPLVTNDFSSSAPNELLKMGYKRVDALRPLAEKSNANITKYNKYASVVANDETLMGTGTDAKVFLGRFASVAGIGGNNLEEKLANTQEIIQTMANRQLEAGAKLKGMPSDKEQALLQKAAGARYNQMTPAELKRVFELAILDEKFILETYNSGLDSIYNAEKTNPANTDDMLNIVNSYKIEPNYNTVTVDY